MEVCLIVVVLAVVCFIAYKVYMSSREKNARARHDDMVNAAIVKKLCKDKDDKSALMIRYFVQKEPTSDWGRSRSDAKIPSYQDFRAILDEKIAQYDEQYAMDELNIDRSQIGEIDKFFIEGYEPRNCETWSVDWEIDNPGDPYSTRGTSSGTFIKGDPDNPDGGYVTDGYKFNWIFFTEKSIKVMTCVLSAYDDIVTTDTLNLPYSSISTLRTKEESIEFEAEVTDKFGKTKKEKKTVAFQYLNFAIPGDDPLVLPMRKGTDDQNRAKAMRAKFDELKG